MAASGEQEIKKLLECHASLSVEGEKVRCHLTGHEMPRTLLAIQTYVNGKKYKKQLEGLSYDYRQYEQFLKPATKKGKRGMLQCQLTLRHINNHWAHIDRHIKGKRFQRAHKRWLDCEAKGEKYVPLAKPKRKRDDDTLETDDVKVNDDMTDLYPFVAEDTDSEDEDETPKDLGVNKRTGLSKGPGLNKGPSKPDGPKEKQSKAQKRKEQINGSEVTAKKFKKEEATAKGQSNPSMKKSKKLKKKKPKM